MSSPIHILLSNDDGVFAPGLFALKTELERAGHRVTVCAPDKPRSATGHAITLHKPLRAKQIALEDDSLAWACSGTPADCVALALYDLCAGDPVNLVVSGMNHGPNLGWDVTYSGTVSAAMEAVICGYPAIAVSVTSYEDAIHWTPGARYVAETLVPAVAAKGLPPVTLLNVNAPSLPESEIRGVKVCTQGDRSYVDRLVKRLDPLGRPYWWLGGTIHGAETAEGTDTHATGDNYISVTPIQLDLTAHAFMDTLRSWDIER
jgi:5'-nucleotidase